MNQSYDSYLYIFPQRVQREHRVRYQRSIEPPEPVDVLFPICGRHRLRIRCTAPAMFGFQRMADLHDQMVRENVGINNNFIVN